VVLGVPVVADADTVEGGRSVARIRMRMRRFDA
jgi:hypothetical protein